VRGILGSIGAPAHKGRDQVGRNRILPGVHDAHVGENRPDVLAACHSHVRLGCNLEHFLHDVVTHHVPLRASGDADRSIHRVDKELHVVLDSLLLKGKVNKTQETSIY